MHVDLPSYGPRPALTRADRVDMYLRVINALMLRDMRTRLFGSYWGWLAWTLWPVAHMFVISLAMAYRKAPPPFGDSIMVFAASGAVPALACTYISAEVMKSMMRSKPLMYYPQVRSLDVAFSSMMVEIVDNFIAVIVICGILLASGIDPVPQDLPTALGGYLSAILLGISLGMVNSAIVQIFPGWALGYVLVRLSMYISAGVVFLASDLPIQIYSIMKWNPLLQIVEWVRLGYEPKLGIEINHSYVYMWILGLMALGLSMERTVSKRYAA